MKVVDTDHFRLEKVERVELLNENSDSFTDWSILLILDLHQDSTSHIDFLDGLREHNTVYVVTLNHTVLDSITHWNPKLSDIQQDISVLETHLPKKNWRGCVGQGIGARLAKWFTFERQLDILCNPVFPDTDIAAAKLLANLLLWRNTKQSRWFTQFIESAWLDALPQPTEGVAPWIAPLPTEQQTLYRPISNGTWKSLFSIIQHPVQFKSNDTHIFLGGQSPNQNLATIYGSLNHGNNIYHRYYPDRRQELLLAESVQRDILDTYLEAR